MKVLQLIDTLETGGAERMAVNYANALETCTDGSYLCSTRKEGVLLGELKKEVGYLFLKKNSSFDHKAFKKLRGYILMNEINIIHAHSTSYFLAVLVKISLKNRVKLIWHDHYGNSEKLNERSRVPINFFSRYFDGVFSVNEKLALWAKTKLACKKVSVLNNFTAFKKVRNNNSKYLKGNQDFFKIICVANLRPQKDHFNLLQAFELIEENKISLHLVGMNFNDKYSEKIFKYIENSQKKEHIFYYGVQENIPAFLNEANLGILSSKSEGLPLALLEYANAGLPVICTDVGQCKTLIAGNGIVVPPESIEKLSNAIKTVFYKTYTFNPNDLKLKVKAQYSEDRVLPEILDFYNQI